jgi:hypothetical protein
LHIGVALDPVDRDVGADFFEALNGGRFGIGMAPGGIANVGNRHFFIGAA